jgi:hypothetical protein
LRDVKRIASLLTRQIGAGFAPTPVNVSHFGRAGPQVIW